jgi:hypothetical protein
VLVLAKYGVTHFYTHLNPWVSAKRLGKTGHLLTQVLVEGSAKASLVLWEQSRTQYLFTVWGSAKALGSWQFSSQTLVALFPKVPNGP